MADSQQQYEADEFDQLAAERQTYGAHRVSRRKYGWVIALIAILIIAPVAGVFGGQLMTHSDKAQELITKSKSEKSVSQKDAEKSESEKPVESEQADDKAAAEQEEAKSDDAKSAAESADAQESAPETESVPESEPVINQAAPVSVLNAAGVQGLAREKAQVLRNAGFTQVVADNYRGNRVTQSAVYYGGAATADTANKVAADLGISLVQENENIARVGGIVVILATR